MDDVYFRLGLCMVLGVALALTAHIFILARTEPLIARLATNPPGHGYPRHMTIMAYVTAFVPVGILVLVYHYAGGLLDIANPFLKTLALAAIILEVKGDFLRQLVMGYLHNRHVGNARPFLIVLLSVIDKWAANVLLAAVLVFFCPVK